MVYDNGAEVEIGDFVVGGWLSDEGLDLGQVLAVDADGVKIGWDSGCSYIYADAASLAPYTSREAAQEEYDRRARLSRPINTLVRS